MRIASRLVIAALLAGGGEAAAQESATRSEVVYATVAGRDLALDLYLPRQPTRPPLVVWVHGGAWRSGSRADPPPIFASNGFALASIDYRLSGEARFPAAVHDIKAAIRYLRAHAGELGFDGGRIAIAGESAGGTWRRWRG